MSNLMYNTINTGVKRRLKIYNSKVRNSISTVKSKSQLIIVDRKYLICSSNRSEGQ